MAFMLLDKKLETSVCIFEKENRLGGKIYDHVFSEAPDRTVGQFSVEKKKQNNCVCVSVVEIMFFFALPQFFYVQKTTGKARIVNDSLDCYFCFILTKDNGTPVKH